MSNSQIKAKVFISCGQTKDTDEVEIAYKIARRLEQLGYEPYVAVEQQTLRALIENIFKQLESSEYFIFIDFKREKIIHSSNEEIHRGSLFCHQELAIAAYLEIPFIAFHEKGVKTEDGIMRFLQGNSIPFSDRHLLPSAIADKVQNNWNPSWKNQLCFYRDPNEFSDRPPNRFFHICVKNLHMHKPAINCYVYLKELFDRRNNVSLPLETIELKWAGYTYPNASIDPGGVRYFDAIWVSHEKPSDIKFKTFADSKRFEPKINEIGEYELTFSVISGNYQPITDKFLLNVGQNLDDIKLSTLT